jgi:hypothetical protein
MGSTNRRLTIRGSTLYPYGRAPYGRSKLLSTAQRAQEKKPMNCKVKFDCEIVEEFGDVLQSGNPLTRPEDTGGTLGVSP